MDKIFVVRGTEQAGPFTEAEIRSQLASGAITGDTMVWWEGLPEWAPLSRTPLGAPAAVPPAVPFAAPPAPPPTAIPPTVSASGIPPRTSTLAIVSLISGIIGLMCWPTALILGIVAVVTGNMARGKMRKDPTESGNGLALAGLVIGYIEIALAVVGIAIYALVMIYAVHHGMHNVQTFTVEDSNTNASSASAPESQGADTNSAATNSATATPTNQ
jgi:hypothetical protein